MVFWLDSITESEIYISQRISQTGLNASIYTGLRAQKISGKEWDGWITLWMLASSAVLISLIRFGLDDNHFRFCQCYELYSNQHHSVSGNSRWRGVYYFHIFSPSSADCFKTKIFREVRSTDRSAHPSIHPNATSVNLHPLGQMFWGPIQKRTVEKSPIYVTNVTMPLLGQTFWGNIW